MMAVLSLVVQDMEAEGVVAQPVRVRRVVEIPEQRVVLLPLLQ
jgi:hypothetical protein